MEPDEKLEPDVIASLIEDRSNAYIVDSETVEHINSKPRSFLDVLFPILNSFIDEIASVVETALIVVECIAVSRVIILFYPLVDFDGYRLVDKRNYVS